MIMIKVEVPILQRQYDFQIDEDQPMQEVQNEIVEMICQANQCELIGDKKRLLFYNQKNHRMITRELSAYENGLATGSVLYLV